MKLFGIGLNKTGTKSLHAALKELGLKSLHFSPDDLPSDERLEAGLKIGRAIHEAQKSGDKLLAHVSEFDGYLDIPAIVQYFEILDVQYPDSLFIYTTRDLESWLDSRERHVKRNLSDPAYKGKWKVIDREGWEQERMAHERRVFEHFTSQSKLLTMDICAGDGYEKLCPFVGRPIPNAPFPKVK